MTPPPGDKGGLLNAIFGSIVLTIGATLLSTPIGMLAGTYLAEYGKKSALAEIVRFINDILLSAPSIVVGLFIYEVLVVPMGHFSAWAGIVVLAVIAIPVIVRTTEDMLNLVPNGLREAASALGTPMWKVIVTDRLSRGAQRHHHRHPAGHRAGQRRDRAAALHGAQQPVLEHRLQRADGEPAGHHLPVRPQPL